MYSSALNSHVYLFITNDEKEPERKIVENSFGKYETVRPWDVSEKIKVPSYIPKPPYSVSGKPFDPPREIEIKNANQIECMRHSCMLAKRILRQIRPMIKVKIAMSFKLQNYCQFLIKNLNN